MTPPPARDTIFALSSGSPPAAIAIVRISGSAASVTIEHLGARLPPPRKAVLAALHDTAGLMLDRALLLWFPGPNSATGEDLAELHLHGGRATVAATLAALAGMPGLRPAAPGEFTRRAFENGRIDLSQAEGLADLLFAETEAQRRNALRVAEGGLARMLDRWRQRLLALSAQVEAEIEFGDEEEIGAVAIGEDLAALRDEIAATLAVPPAERLRDGVRILLAGPPNAGKSSLINALAGRDVALATPIPGTTRDLIEAPVVLGGAPCILIDSAGVHDATDDLIEQLGIDRSRRAMEDADVILWLGAGDDAPPGNVIIVAARCDVQAPSTFYDVAVSSVTGEGLDSLRSLLTGRVAALLPGENQLAVHARIHAALQYVTVEVGYAFAATDALIVAESLRSAINALNGLSGRNSVEDMLDKLFGTFCIGK